MSPFPLYSSVGTFEGLLQPGYLVLPFFFLTVHRQGAIVLCWGLQLPLPFIPL